MAEGRVRRRLAAILAADVVGYSRLVRADEEGTLARLNALRKDVIDPSIARYDGRIVKLMGDGMLAEFPSVVDAVRNALEVQTAVAEHQVGVPEDRRIVFRVGVNLGDVVIDGDDIQGDGVNLAARLEGIADPGGICISEKVHEEVRDRVAVAFEDSGEQKIKNINRPVRVWRWTKDAKTTARGHVAADEPLPLPDKPSIAVLPFVNMSGNVEQEYFADGITEDIITALSRIRWFFVIARNSTFAYKGQSPNITDVARDLGIGYVLEGSVRKAGNRVRITAQLVEGATGNHVWAKRYDRELEDIFEVQDEITETIVGAIEPELGRAERERAKARRPDNLRGWDLYQRGMWHTYQRSKEDLAAAQELFRQAIELDPHLSLAHAGCEEACYFQVIGGYAETPDELRSNGVALGRRAVELDDQDAFAHYALGRALTLMREHSEAIAALETAIELNPSFAQAHYALGHALGSSGQPEAAIPHIETAMRLSPHDPFMGQFMVRMSEAHLFMRQHAEAVNWARRSLRQPNIQWSRWAMLASALAHSGETEEARRAVEAMNRMRPEATLEFARNYWPISDGGSLEYLIEGLRKAGLPD